MKLSVYENQGGGPIAAVVAVGGVNSGMLFIENNSCLSKIYPKSKAGIFRGYDLQGDNESEAVFLKSLSKEENKLLVERVSLAAEFLFDFLSKDRDVIEIDLLPKMIGVEDWSSAA